MFCCNLIDGTSEDVAEAYRVVRDELISYGGGLTDKPELVALNKCDALIPEEIESKLAILREITGAEVLPLSGVAGIGIRPLLFKLLATIEESRAAQGNGSACRRSHGRLRKGRDMDTLR